MYCMLDENFFLTRDFVSLECSLMPLFPPSHYVVPGTEPSISHILKQVSTWCAVCLVLVLSVMKCSF